MMSDDALLDFCRSLVSTIRSGLTLSDAFETLSRSSRHGRVVRRAAELTNQGKFLHEAFAAQGVFPAVFIALLRAGEEGGKIDEFLEIYADCLEVRIKFRREIERLLIYPVFVLALSGALFLLVSFKVVPAVMEPLLKSGASLPPQAFLFSSLAERLYASWYKLLLAGSLAILALRWFMDTGLGRKLTGLATHWLPLLRFATAEGRLYYIYTTLALLFKAGLQPGAMMAVLAQFSQDDLITRRRLRRAAAKLSGGESFARSMAALMPEEDRLAAEVAEKAGRLDDTLLARAKLHYDRHLHRLKILVTAFNISTMVAIAVVCFGLILTVAWPAVSMMSGSKDIMKSLGLGSPESAATPRLPANPRKTQAPRLPLEELKTRAFNEESGKKVMGFIRQHGAPAGGEKAAPAEQEQPPRKRPQARFEFGKSTTIRPTKIGD
jgi:type II secretory pathway component PulF